MIKKFGQIAFVFCLIISGFIFATAFGQHNNNQLGSFIILGLIVSGTGYAIRYLTKDFK